MMIDRQLIGDVGLAILLAVPTLALSRPQPAALNDKPAVAPLIQQAALAQSPTERRFSLDG